jgi:hypothetical protein
MRSAEYSRYRRDGRLVAICESKARMATALPEIGKTEFGAIVPPIPEVLDSPPFAALESTQGRICRGAGTAYSEHRDAALRRKF